MPTPGHESFMALALREARRGEGLTRPNPAVGAVLVKNGRIVAKGFHRKAGTPHAEIVALRNAKESVRGATLYVTLEPCSTWGRTPPCVDAILYQGISRVVVGCHDPNPRHAGRGVTLLRKHGVDVIDGVLRKECEELIAPFVSHMLRKRPLVTLKLGMTLDGRIADRTGTSKWITGPAARRRVQELRRRCDAILVGVGTALADDPSLLPRPSKGRRPYRVIVDSRGRLSPRAACLTDGAADQTILATTTRCSAARRRAYERAGATVLVFPGSRGRVPLKALVRKLASLDVMHVLCEGGGELAGALMREGLVDRLALVVAPSLLGGDAVPALGGAGRLLSKRWNVRIDRVEPVGRDLWIKGRMA